MTAAHRAWRVLRESIAASWAQPVASAVTIVIVAGMCAAVLLTTGRTVGSEQDVLGSIDSEGTRSIVVRADAASGLDSRVLQRIANIDGITWAGAFGPAEDFTNTAIPDGQRVPVRAAWDLPLVELGIPANQPLAGASAWGSELALAQLGLPDAAGSISAASGSTVAVAGRLGVPDYLAFLEPLVVVPQPPGETAAVGVLVVVADRPDLVAPVSAAVQSVLAVDDPALVTLTTSESLASLRALIEGQLGAFGRNLIVIIFSVTALLVAAILYGLVMMRRKDFGRRRALGAARSLIIALLLCQMLVLSTVGAVVGCVAAAIGLAAGRDPLPGLDFFTGVAVLAILVGLVAALLPATVASRRDPLKELRVP